MPHWKKSDILYIKGKLVNSVSKLSAYYISKFFLRTRGKIFKLLFFLQHPTIFSLNCDKAKQNPVIFYFIFYFDGGIISCQLIS